LLRTVPFSKTWRGWLLLLGGPVLLAQGVRIERDDSGRVAVQDLKIPAAGVSRVRVVATGGVTLQGGGGGQVECTLRQRLAGAQDHPDLRFQSERQGELLLLTVGARHRGSAPPRLEIRLPGGFKHYGVETRSGAVNLDGLAGDVDAITGGGPVNAGRLHARLTARTGGGPIELGVVHGPVRCITGGGDIRVQRAGTEISLETGGGSIWVEEAAGAVQATTAAGNVEVLRALGPVSAKTLAGVIKVGEAAGGVNAESFSGGISISSANGVRCDSSVGTVRLKDVSGRVNVSVAKGAILAELAARAALMESLLRSAAGDITVWIPSNLAVTIRAENETPGRYGRLVSEFPEIRPPAGRGPMAVQGELNGGGPILRIAAAQGTIFLRRRD
jgi:hypothetical protein